MARPQKYYIFFEYGRATAIYHGLKALYAATGQRVGGFKFRNQLAAEEYAAWANHEYDTRQAAITAEIRARIVANGRKPLTLRSR